MEFILIAISQAKRLMITILAQLLIIGEPMVVGRVPAQ
jgi:hypothetical protein